MKVNLLQKKDSIETLENDLKQYLARLDEIKNFIAYSNETTLTNTEQMFIFQHRDNLIDLCKTIEYRLELARILDKQNESENTKIFTGFKDVNGKNIFSGDNCKMRSGARELNFTVLFRKGLFIMEFDSGADPCKLTQGIIDLCFVEVLDVR